MPDSSKRQTEFSVSVVTPAYGELPNLRVLLPQTRRMLEAAPVGSSEIIVVLPCEASDDEVAEVNDLGARAVRRGPSDSFGDALRTGFAEVSPESDLVLTMDADGSHDPAAIPRLLAAMGDDVDLVVASRYTRGGQTDNPPVLRLMSRALNFAYKVILKIECDDISTNYKVYRRDQLAGVDLGCTDFDVIEELMFALHQQRGPSFEVVEVPDHFHERRFGETKRRLGPFTVSYLLTLVRLRWRARAGGA